MQGRKISLEDRGPEAKKLGRRFKYNEGEGERIVVTLMLQKGDMEKLITKTKSTSKADAISKLINKALNKK